MPIVVQKCKWFKLPLTKIGTVVNSQKGHIVKASSAEQV